MNSLVSIENNSILVIWLGTSSLSSKRINIGKTFAFIINTIWRKILWLLHFTALMLFLTNFLNKLPHIENLPDKLFIDSGWRKCCFMSESPFKSTGKARVKTRFFCFPASSGQSSLLALRNSLAEQGRFVQWLLKNGTPISITVGWWEKH